jgi:two-component system, OmpR family, sensor histidine kinase KdpD
LPGGNSGAAWKIIDREETITHMIWFRIIFQRYGYLLALVSVSLATALFYLGRDYFAKGQWALLYLLIISIVASLSGFRSALVAAVLSFFFWNYFFLPPFHMFMVDDPKDWLSLLVFLVVGVIIGLQTGRLRDREAQALAREKETALLNRFAAHIISDISLQEMAQVLTGEIAEITNAQSVALFLPDETDRLQQISARPRSPSENDNDMTLLTEWVFRQSRAVGIPAVKDPSVSRGWPPSVSHREAGVSKDRRDVLLPLQTATWRAGVLHIGERSDGSPHTLPEIRLVIALANQAAAFLERKHLQSRAIQADALREADRLKSTLVSSVSHELKTPLSSLTATVTNLLEGDMELDMSSVRSELQAVREDVDRLNDSIGSLVDLSRLESAAWEPRKESYELGEIIGTTLSRISAKQRPRVLFSLPEDLPMIKVDFIQWSRVLQNLLENALIYGGEDTPVKIGASCDEKDVHIWVEDEGPGIPPEDRTRIFEKFFRGRSSAKAGTGLGLAITQEIVRFHGGTIRVEDVKPHGARFIISLPREE